MLKKIIIVATFILLYMGFLLFPQSQLPGRGMGPSPPLPEFPSVQKNHEPPTWWKQSTFQLSQNYPTEPPSEICPPDVCTWKNFDYKTQPKEYLIEVLKHAYNGNLEKDWDQPKTGAKWFHAPWMHYGSTGREFIHGLTRERTACNEELKGGVCSNKPTTSTDEYFESWAVSLYDERGAYYFRKVWEEMYKPNPDLENVTKTGFPEGTVSIKLLFTAAPAEGIDYLENSVGWWGDTRRAKTMESTNGEGSCDGKLSKCFTKLSLLQVDVAVKVNDAPTGWVFGTFTYHKDSKNIYDYPGLADPTLSAEAKNNIEKWLRLEPIGLIYGNNIGKGMEETRPFLTLTPQHMGCDGRLNGPVDNPLSSCISCHSAAETRRDFDFEKLLGQQGFVTCDDKSNNPAKAPWFRNINPNSDKPEFMTFVASQDDQKIYSFDYSLQLQKGIQRCCKAQLDNRNLGPLELPEPNACSCDQTGTKSSRGIKAFLEMTRNGIENQNDK